MGGSHHPSASPRAAVSGRKWTSPLGSRSRSRPLGSSPRTRGRAETGCRGPSEEAVIFEPPGLTTIHFDSAHSLEETLIRYVRLYNHQIQQKAIGHMSLVQALKEWQEKRPELFKKKVYYLTALDTMAC